MSMSVRRKFIICIMAVISLFVCGVVFAVPDPTHAPTEQVPLVSGSAKQDVSTDTDLTEDEAAALKTRTIGIDPGHQGVEDTGLEYIAPNSIRTKIRMSRGTVGTKSGIAESAINMQIAEKLRALLEHEGVVVVMTRTSDDVNISNYERAIMMNDAQVDLWIRLHCDNAISSRTSGASMLVPSRSNNPLIYKQSLALGKNVLNEFCLSTGAQTLSVRALMNQTGFNWSEVPVVAIEMGYLSNAQDDVNLNSDTYQNCCASGIFNGIVSYFMEESEPDNDVVESADIQE